MALFIGEYNCKLDEKGRVVFPSAFKSELAECSQKRLVIHKDFYQKCLSLYTVDAWKALTAEMKSKLNLFNKEHAQFWRAFMRDSAEVTPDERSGRILIPRRLLEMISVEREITFVGFDDKVEVWATNEYEKQQMTEQEFSDAAAKLLG